MTDNQSLTTHKKAELERFSFSEQHPMTIESHEDQISIIQFWRVLQKRRWLVIGSDVDGGERGCVRAAANDSKARSGTRCDCAGGRESGTRGDGIQ